MKEEWLLNGAVVPVDVETTAALVAEIKRLIGVVGGMALAKPEQEPVAIIHRNEYNEYRLEPHDNFDINIKSIPFNVDVSLFKLPQRKPLTDEEMDVIYFCVEGGATALETWREQARAIEAAHGIKENT